MSPLAKFEAPASWQVPVDVAAVVSDAQSTQTAVLPRDSLIAQPLRPEEPSTLAMALIGAGALIVFRGAQKLVGAKAVAAQATLLPIKPRRRAA